MGEGQLRAVLIGCACAGGIGGGYYAFGSGGHDASQIVHKDPATVYEAFDDAFTDMVNEGNNGLAAERGQTATIDKVAGKSIDIKVQIEGKQALRLRFGFEPVKGGDTKATADIDVDQAVMRESIQRVKGSDVALPPIPDFAMNMAMQNLLSEAAKKIEKGEPLERPHSTYAMAGGISSSNYSTYGQTDWAKKYREEQAMRNASAPMMDPDEAARNYMGSHAYDR
jgi:hypothetical protein